METERNIVCPTQQDGAVIDRKTDGFEFNSAVTATATLVEDLNSQMPSTEDADKLSSTIAGKLAELENIKGIVEKLTVRCLNSLCGVNTKFLLSPDFCLNHYGGKKSIEEICQNSDELVEDYDVSMSSNLAENETVQVENSSEKEESVDEEESVEDEEDVEEDEYVEDEESDEEEEPGEEEEDPDEEESDDEEESVEEEGSDEEEDEEPDEEDVDYIQKKNFEFFNQNIDEVVQKILDEYEDHYKFEVEKLMKEAINSCLEDLRDLSAQLSGLATTLKDIQTDLYTQLRDYLDSQMQNETTD